MRPWWDLAARGVQEEPLRWRRRQGRGTGLVKNEILVFRGQRGVAWAGHGMLVGKGSKISLKKKRVYKAWNSVMPNSAIWTLGSRPLGTSEGLSA